MCLAIPARVLTIDEALMAQVDIHGVERRVSLDLTPDAEVGGWVLIHAGYAIQVVDEQFAAESWELISEMAAAGEDFITVELGPGETSDADAGETAGVATDA